MQNLWFLLILTVFLFLMLCKITDFDILSPGMITIGTFILSELAVVYCKNIWNVHYSFKAFAILFVGLLIIFFTEFFAIMLSKKNISTNAGESLGYISFDKTVKITVILVSVIFTVIFILDIYRKGSALVGRNDVSFIGLVKEDENIGAGFFSKICLRLGRCLAYASVFLFSYNVTYCNKTKKELWLLIPALMHCIQILFSGGRLGIFMLVGTVFFYLIMLSRMRNGWKSANIKRFLKPIIVSFIVLLIGFFFVREIVKNRENNNSFIYYFAYYLGNSTYLFNLMLGKESSVFSNNIYWGAYTFRELYNELQKYGLFENNNKLSLNFLYLNANNLKLHGGNVYTLFGPPYNDFGFVGMCIYVFVLYIILCFIYYRCFKYPKNKYKNLMLLFVFGIYYSNMFIAFYETPTALFKIQSILETAIMCIFILCMQRVKIKIK